MSLSPHSTSAGPCYFRYGISSQCPWHSGKTTHVPAVPFMPPQMRAYFDAAAPIWNHPHIANQFTQIHAYFYMFPLL